MNKNDENNILYNIEINNPQGLSLQKSLLGLHNRHFALIDLVLFLLTPTMALGLRVSLPWQEDYFQALLLFTLISILVKFLVLNAFRMYSRYWRYASVDELITITFSVVVATFINTGIIWVLQGLLFEHFIGLPRSVPLLDGLLTLIVVGGSRFSIRIVEYWVSRDPKHLQGKRVLIVGAGDAGEMVVREIFSSKLISLKPVGFVDDDQEKIGSVIHGIRVLGSISEIPYIVNQYQVDEVIIAIPSAPGQVIRDVLNLCMSVGIPSRTVPGIYEILNGRIGIDRLRKVAIEDLLRRSPIQITSINVADMLCNRKVLVTGAGGSIGSELCRQILKYEPEKLILLGHGENSIFELEMQLLRLRNEYEGNKSTHIVSVIGDIRDMERMRAVFSRLEPDIIFHAAAHKHVPLMQENPEEAITNNIFGTRNLVELSMQTAVEKFVLISTDKAVNPVNMMGMTKRVAEQIVCKSAQSSGRSFLTVRFGNVLGSRGSMVPIFQEQIAMGGPITITHPDVTRFFMTIPEAVQLVLQAAAMGSAGDIYVLDMGQPVKIVDLVKDMVEISGYKLGEDIEIVYTGLRPGEKLFEELFTKNEKPNRTEHEKIFVASSHNDSNYDQLYRQLDELNQLLAMDNIKKLVEKLMHLASDK